LQWKNTLSCKILFLPYYSVLYWTGEGEYTSGFNNHFYKVCYYFCLIILSSTQLVILFLPYNPVQCWTGEEEEYISDFQFSLYSFKICCIFAILFCPILNWWRWVYIRFSVIIKCNFNFVDKRVFKILEFHHTN
jgi:hypothetical protein